MSLKEPIQQILGSLLGPLLEMLSLMIAPIILIPAIIVAVILVKKNKEYKNDAYYQITKLPYLSVKHDLGRYGEYLTYKYLKKYETSGAKFLFNIYIPKADGETTEIDVLMICSKGIFVFESKNYSGWIFGSENQKNWYQTLPTGRGRSHKEHFYNPVMQNRSHIKHLEAFLGEQLPMHSIITFSDRCTLKNVQIKSSDISVINRYNVATTVSSICNEKPDNLLCENKIAEIYNKLYPYTQIDEMKKTEHIANIRNNLDQQSIQQSSTPVESVSREETVESNITEQPKTEGGPTVPTDNIELKTVQVDNISELQTNETEINEPQVLKCPKCNGNLILRTATRGANAGNQFYGCSNYPRCKYIKSMD